MGNNVIDEIILTHFKVKISFEDVIMLLFKRCI